MAITTIEQAAAALKFEIAGIVQGVGFRPHVDAWCDEIVERARRVREGRIQHHGHHHH